MSGIPLNLSNVIDICRKDKPHAIQAYDVEGTMHVVRPPANRGRWDGVKTKLERIGVVGVELMDAQNDIMFRMGDVAARIIEAEAAVTLAPLPLGSLEVMGNQLVAVMKDAGANAAAVIKSNNSSLAHAVTGLSRVNADYAAMLSEERGRRVTAEDELQELRGDVGLLLQEVGRLEAELKGSESIEGKGLASVETLAHRIIDIMTGTSRSAEA